MFDFIKNLFGRKKSGTCKACSGCSLSAKKTLLNLTDEDVEILKNCDENIILGKIIEVYAHPDPKITRVQITKCDLGNGLVEQILCGGTNVSIGIMVPVAKVGTKLSEDFEIGERKIRGEVSRGMICARTELGISSANEAKGEIWILPAGTQKKLGQQLKSIF
jgi:phenylalanyl-tRNA synthetase beta chain